MSCQKSQPYLSISGHMPISVYTILQHSVSFQIGLYHSISLLYHSISMAKISKATYASMVYLVPYIILIYIIQDPIFSTQHLTSSRLGGLSLLHPKVMSSRNVHLCGGDPWICGVLQTVGTINRQHVIGQHVINRSINRQHSSVPTSSNSRNRNRQQVNRHSMT